MREAGCAGSVDSAPAPVRTASVSRVDDDATELAELRRRAYGPDADIASDPGALARLTRLEDAARSVRAAVRSLPDGPMPDEPTRDGPTADGPVPDDPTPDDPTPDDPTPDDPMPRESTRATAVSVIGRRDRPRWHGALVLGVAVVAICLAAVGAQSPVVMPAPVAASPPLPDPLGHSSPFGADPAARVVSQVLTEGALSDYLPAPPTARPSFPVPEELLWSSPLGNYYGWALWLARSRSGLPCMALVRTGQDVRASCVLPARFNEGALVVSVPYAAIPPADRPQGMLPRESLGFEWLTDSTVSIVVGRAAPPPTP